MEAHIIVAIFVGVLAVIGISVTFLAVLFRAVARDREMLGELQPDRARVAPVQAAETEPAPVGTLAVMLLYLMVIVGLWGTAYAMLLQRG